MDTGCPTYFAILGKNSKAISPSKIADSIGDRLSKSQQKLLSDSLNIRLKNPTWDGPTVAKHVYVNHEKPMIGWMIKELELAIDEISSNGLQSKVIQAGRRVFASSDPAKITEIELAKILADARFSLDFLKKIYSKNDLNFYDFYIASMKYAIIPNISENGLLFGRFKILSEPLQDFPFIVPYPTRSNLSLDDFNKTIGTGFHYLGLSPLRKELNADGLFYSPTGFFLHDVLHAENYIERTRRSSFPLIFSETTNADSFIKGHLDEVKRWTIYRRGWREILQKEPHKEKQTLLQLIEFFYLHERNIAPWDFFRKDSFLGVNIDADAKELLARIQDRRDFGALFQEPQAVTIKNVINAINIYSTYLGGLR